MLELLDERRRAGVLLEAVQRHPADLRQRQPGRACRSVPSTRGNGTDARLLQLAGPDERRPDEARHRRRRRASHDRHLRRRVLQRHQCRVAGRRGRRRARASGRPGRRAAGGPRLPHGAPHSTAARPVPTTCTAGARCRMPPRRRRGAAPAGSCRSRRSGCRHPLRPGRRRRARWRRATSVKAAGRSAQGGVPATGVTAVVAERDRHRDPSAAATCRCTRTRWGVIGGSSNLNVDAPARRSPTSPSCRSAPTARSPSTTTPARQVIVDVFGYFAEASTVAGGALPRRSTRAACSTPGRARRARRHGARRRPSSTCRSGSGRRARQRRVARSCST